MNNNLKKLYNALQTIGMIDIDFEKFVQYMGKESYQQKVFQVVSEEKLFDGDFNRFKSGYAPKFDDSFYSNVTTDTVQESQEKNTWIEDTFGKTGVVGVVTDFFGDLYRAGAQGWAAGRSVDEALEIYKKGKDLTDEDLQAFLDANKRIQEAGTQDEMQEYLKIYEEAGGGAWGAIKGFAYNPSIFYTTIISSISQMVASAVDSEEVLGTAAASSGVGAGVGAGIGAAAGSVGGPLAALTAAGGAVSGALGGFFGGLTGVMETGNTLAQLLQEELGEGVEMTKENVRAILEDDQKFQSLKNKAVARGLTIGAIEGVTAGLSRGVGAKAFTKGLTGTTKRKLAATVLAGEMTAGAGGEFLGQKAAGQKTEFSDIFLEGIAEAKGVMNIADILAKKSYTLNGGEATVADIESFFNDPNISDADKANADVKVEGDKKLQSFVDFSKIRATILSQIDPKVTDQKDRSKLVELQRKKIKAESDVKKDGVYAVPNAKKILEDINAEIEAILGKYEGAVGFGESEAALDVQQKRFEKSKAKIESEVKQLKEQGENIQIVSKEEFAKLTKLNPNDEVVGAGVNIDGVKYINLDAAAAAENIAVATHELLHDSVDNTFASLNKVQQSKLLTDFFNMLDDTQFSYLKRKLVADGVQGNTINEVVLSLLEKGVATEVFTKFSDGIRENKIQYNETVFSKLKNVVEEILRQLSELGVIPERLKILHRKEFSNARQVYNFLKDFNKTFDKKGRVSKRAKALSAKFPKTGVAFSKVEISKKAAEAQARVDAIGKKAATKAEYDAGINVEAYNYLIDEGNLDGLILSNLVRQGIDVQAKDANVNGVPLDNFIEDVKSKMIPEVLGFNPDIETTAQGKFGLSGYINQRLNYRIGDVSTKAKRTVTGRSIDKPIDDSGKTAAETVVAEKDVKTEAFEEQDLSIGAATRTEETQQESSELKSRYRHKLKNNDGTKLIGEEQVEDIRDGVRSALRNIAPETKSENFLLSYENKIKKTMKNIVQRSIGSGLKYQNFVLKNIEAIIDFSTVQDLVAMERLVGKGKLKDGKKIFTVPVKRLTKQEDIQKAIDQGKLPPDAIDKSAEGVFLSEKRMPTREELIAFFFGKDMQNVLGYEIGSSTLGTRKDGLSRMIVTELAQDATMETLQEPAVMEDILSSNVELHADILVKDISNKIKRSPDLKFSKVLVDQIKDGRLLLDNNGLESSNFNNWLNNSETLSEAKYRVINDFLNRQYENYRTVRKLVGKEKIDEVKKRILLKNPEINLKVWKVFEIIGIEEVGEALKGVEGYRLEYTMPNEKGKALDISIITPDGENIGIEVKGTTARGVATDINIAIKKGKAAIKLAGDKVREFFQDNANENNPLESFEKIEQEIVKATNELIEIINANPGLGKIETTAQGNLILTDKQRNSRKVVKKIKQLKSRLNKVKTYVSTQLIVDQYNKKGNQYINIGLSGLKRLGVENPLQLDESKVPNLADEKSQIRQTVRMRIASNGRIVFKVETQLDSRDFSKSEINLYNKNAAKQVFDASAITKNPELFTAKNINKASDKSRNKSYSKVQKGASIFDFDETVGISENFVIAKKGKKTVRISSEDWPVVGEQYAEQGWSFDFTDFNRVTKGRPGPLMQKIKNQIKKYGPSNVFILTARAPQSEIAIHEWLKSQDVNIPLKNITGLGDSTGEAKAMWVLGKYANEGYNDIYFVDDALSNVQAVQNVFNQLDIKGKSVQAKMSFSKTMKGQFNDILSRKGMDVDVDPARAKFLGKDIGRREFFIAPGADDFQGLMLRLAGKGDQGNKDVSFFKKAFFDPYNRAYRKLNQVQYNMMHAYSQVRKEHKDVIKGLKKKFDKQFTNEQAIRIYLWDKQGFEVPGLSNKERSAIAKKVANNKEMVSFANKVRLSLQLDKNAYPAPKESWSIGSIKGDMYDAVNSVHREQALAEWQENVDMLLNDPAQMAKLEAGLGTVYVEALKDMLYRMRTGKHRPSGNNKLTNTALNWLQGSVGAIMFFNIRSATLQLISTINYINHTDNNLFAVGKAILNTKQFAKDFKMIFNSPQLKVRRSGLQQDIQTADLADSLSRGGTAANVLAYLLKIGFTPTQVADSAAISLGGAIFYRNRLNTYLKEGMSQKDAEAQAMLDFQDITEEAQQSSRPDRISQQQASPVGRLLLAFQNTPLQYNRLIKKAVSNIANKRGDLRTNISRIVYYGTAQSLIFYTLQQALFVKDDIEEEEVPNSIKREYNAGVKSRTIKTYNYPDVTYYYEEKKEQMKLESMLNSMSDSWLRGSGIKGALVSTAKNVVRSFMKESEKGYRADYFNTFVELMNVSPQVGSKARKVKRALDTYKFNREVMSDMSAFDIDNPAYPMFTSIVEGLTNAPLHRLYTKADNLKEAFNKENTAMQRVMVALGWNQWSVGIDTYKDVREAKTEAKEQEQLAAEKKYKADQKRELEEYKKGKRTLKSITCRAATASGSRCKRKPVKFGKCSIHVK